MVTETVIIDSIDDSSVRAALIFLFLTFAFAVGASFTFGGC